MQKSHLILALAIALLAGCSANPEPSPDPSHGSGPTRGAEGAPSQAPSEDRFASLWRPVPCDLDREPTPAERAYLVEPGRFAEGGDIDEAIDAVLELEPVTAKEWSTAILTLTQPDFAERICAMAQFKPETIDPAKFELPPGAEAEAATSSHFAVVLDASGSMAAKSGSSTRMEEAKSAIRDFVAELPEGATVSLRVHGHEGSNSDADKARSCAASEEIYSGPPAGEGFANALDGVAPVGWTPLGKAITDARADIPDDATTAIMYVVSDGEETCGGDPVKAARDVAASGVEPIVNVIGFAVAPDERASLEAIAGAGGGRYTDVRDGADLAKHFEEEHERLRQAWRDWKKATQGEINEAYQADFERFREAANGLNPDIRSHDLTVNHLEKELRFRNHMEHEVWGEVIDLNDAHHELARDYVKAYAQQLDDLKEAHKAVWEELEGEVPEDWRELYGDE